MEGVKIAPDDTLSPEIETTRLAELAEQFIEVIQTCGDELEDGNGWYACFRLDGKNHVTCKYLTKIDEATGDMPGVYVDHYTLFKRWEDGSYLEKQLSYSLVLGIGVVSESYYRFDKDGGAKIWYEPDIRVADPYELSYGDSEKWKEINDGYNGYNSDFREADYENLCRLSTYLSEETAVDPEDLEYKEWEIFTASSQLYKKLILSDN